MKITTRTLKTGQMLLKPGTRIENLYILQSGCVSICLTKNSRLIEVAKLFSPFSIGDEAAFGPLSWTSTALALRDSSVIEIPVALVREQLDKAPLMHRMLIKALSDTCKASFAELKAQRSNRETLPCPPEFTSKIFGVIFHTARILGTAGDRGTSVSWEAFRDYAHEVFDEPLHRLEDGIGVLLKMGYASLHQETLTIYEMKQIEAFFEYYSNSYFRSSNKDFLKTDPKSTKVTEEFIKVSNNYPTDRGGFAHLPFKATMDAMKAALGQSFESDQLFRLEQKGLLMKRVANAEGGTLSFYKPDFEQMILNWKVLKEIETWNENGFVNSEGSAGAVTLAIHPSAASQPAEVDYAAERQRFSALLTNWKPAASEGKVPQIRTETRKPEELWCPVCMSVIQKSWKSCEVCGNPIA
ncbi:MAG: cyclic nucleotide-binding domain-containing protein [Methylotenera sp.]|nr:cyclic nucleotide-binding domain-containing protein [Oligoflexia bacterium]